MNAVAALYRLSCSLLVILLLAGFVAGASGCRPTVAPTPTPTATSVRPTPAPTPRPVATITPAEVFARSAGADQLLVYDARSREEYAAGHLPGAVALPLGELPQRLAEIPRDRLVVFYCSGST